MKRINRTDWDAIKNLESIDGKFADGTEYRLFKCPETGIIEMLVEHSVLAKQNQTEKFEPVIQVMGFGYPVN